MKQPTYWLEGQCIHIGEWDHQYREGDPTNPIPEHFVLKQVPTRSYWLGERCVYVGDAEPPPAPIETVTDEKGRVRYTLDGDDLEFLWLPVDHYYDGENLVHKGKWDLKLGPPVATNPLPDGVEVRESDVVETSDGGRAAKSDYRTLRRAEYPSMAEQLDALWKGGADAEAMREKVLRVKRLHPKTGAHQDG